MDQCSSDKVDILLEQWRNQRPDLDFKAMGTIGRIKRCTLLLQKKIESKLSELELSLWEFDMLATLRRSGAPYCMSPTDLFSMLMVTSGTMTHRLNSLEVKGWIERLPNEKDARSSLVKLTKEGYLRIDKAVEIHLENERIILSGMSDEEIENLDRNLSKLLKLLE